MSLCPTTITNTITIITITTTTITIITATTTNTIYYKFQLKTISTY